MQIVLRVCLAPQLRVRNHQHKKTHSEICSEVLDLIGIAAAHLSHIRAVEDPGMTPLESNLQIDSVLTHPKTRRQHSCIVTRLELCTTARTRRKLKRKTRTLLVAQLDWEQM